MALFYRLFQHLLPDGIAWRPRDAAQEAVVGEDHAVDDPGLNVGSLFGRYALWQFIAGLAGAPEDARDAIDGVYGQISPNTTTELGEWERQFGIPQAATTSARKQAITSAWQAQGGQSPRYLQDIVQAAGFALYIHEWWDPAIARFWQAQCGEPIAACGEARAECGVRSFRRFVRNPRLYTEDPLFGNTQCGEPAAQCGEALAHCSSLLVNEPGYLVNLDLTREPPPIIPNVEALWHQFIYFGAATFPNHATVPASRRDELERLVLKHRPAEKWVVMLVDYV